MSKLDVAVTIIGISVALTFLAGCRGSLDDIASIAAKKGSNAGDDVARQVPNRTAVVTAVSRNDEVDELLAKCRRQVRESFVDVAWEQVKSSGGKVSENYLIEVARDGIQKCTVGEVLDESAKLTQVASYIKRYW
ncbi:hypothetical protein [Microseira wollei]|uniref:Lipoprotein n=1 Tax=Microseira wollei NIES-4236 TaxID=2530354 RepID=A0AAV3XMN1_9CYAN|nr:hypothetical protein [Microseira wollei]GET41737.1 hypothetical protein MiSe_65510 [Microseira wollei NIES-4236]